MTTYCIRCSRELDRCAVLNDSDVCTTCALDALKLSRRNTRPVVVASQPDHRPLGKITPDEWATFTGALDAVVRGGEVHQRDMRPRIRGRIQPSHIGACYSRAIALGLLREIRRERSNDVAGRNTNKDEPVYAYSPAENRSAA